MCPQRKGKWGLGSHMASLEGNIRSMPCLNYLVSWPALLQNMRGILIRGLESTKEQPWEVILLCVAITAEFPQIYNLKKWTGKDTWATNAESLLISCGYQGPAPRSLPPGFNRIKLLHFKDPQNSSYQGRQRGTSAYLCISLFPWGAPVCSVILHWHHVIFTRAVTWESSLCIKIFA